jgi:hypothetical protein
MIIRCILGKEEAVRRAIDSVRDSFHAILRVSQGCLILGSRSSQLMGSVTRKTSAISLRRGLEQKLGTLYSLLNVIPLQKENKLQKLPFAPWLT